MASREIRIGLYKIAASKIILKELQKGGRDWHRRMIKERLSGPTSSKSLSVRSGALRQSLDYKVSSHGTRFRLTAFTRNTVKYAKIHEFGGVIRPRRAKMLAIPFTPKGQRKVPASLAFGPRRFPGPLTVAKSKKGTLLLVQPRKKGRKTDLPMISKPRRRTRPVLKGDRPKFILKESVRIPPRMGFRKLFFQKTRELRVAIRGQLKDLRVKLSV